MKRGRLCLSLCLLLVATGLAAQSQVDISGDWRGSDGKVYRVEQSRMTFVMRPESGRPEYRGSLRGNNLQATYAAQSGESWITGEVKSRSNGWATRIEWSNGLVLTRGAAVQEVKPIEPEEKRKEDPKLLKPIDREDRRVPYPDISGRWFDNQRRAYEIEQSGREFQVVVADQAVEGRGRFEGEALRLTWENTPNEELQGHITQLDEARNWAVRIEWSNGLVLVRGFEEPERRPERRDEPQPEEPERRFEEPKHHDEPQPEEPERRIEPRPEDRDRPEWRDRQEGPEPFDISGHWFSNVGREVEIEQRGGDFEWFTVGMPDRSGGVIRGEMLRIFLPGEGGEVEGRVAAAEPGGRAMRLEWADGVVFQREPFLGLEHPRLERPEERPELRERPEEHPERKVRPEERPEEQPEREVRPEERQPREEPIEAVPGQERPRLLGSGFQDLQRVEDAVGRLERYHFRVQRNPGLFYEGEYDLAEGRLYFQMGVCDDGIPTAEVYASGESGVGRKLGRDDWFNVKISPLPNDIRDTLELLRSGRMVSAVASDGRNPFDTKIDERQDHWLLEFLPPDESLAGDDFEQFFRQHYADQACCKGEEFITRAGEFGRGMVMRIVMTVSKEDYLISSVRYVCSFADGSTSTTLVQFGPSQVSIPSPRYSDDRLSEQEIPMELLLLRVDTLGGWYDTKCHSPWAQRSVNLIKAKDNDGKYAEIYDSSWSTAAYTESIARGGTDPDYKQHHPIVLGAYYEDNSGAMPQFFDDWFKSDSNYSSNKDYFWNTAGYFRDYHHFGTNGQGLQEEWYFVFRGTPPATTLPGDRYYHCRDWGFGYGRIDENLNRMTWTEAIKQYNSYTWEGKRRAYLMLGFVVHLLQDQGHPDHANNAAHPGSGMDEEEAYKRYSYCHLIAAEAALAAAAACASTGIGAIVSAACAASAYGIAYAACEATIDANEMGHEKLIADKWDISKVVGTISSTGVVKKSNYNAYFDDMGAFALAEMKSAGLGSVLGCGTLTVPPVGIPGADPDIQSDDPTATAPYYKLQEKLTPPIICSTAGLIEHFYEIVNHPPYLQRLAIVQWEPRDTPRAFAFFANDKYHCLRYDAEWVTSGGARTLKQNVTAQKLSLDRPAYVFALFGPTDIGPITGGKKMREATVRLTGVDPADGTPIDTELTLTEADDSKLGTYYWGYFQPCNCSNDPYMLKLEVSGADPSAHLSSRSPSGDELDGNPATLATVASTKYPNYPFVDYEAGVDVNHSVTISTFQWSLDVQPQSLLFVLGSVAERRLTKKQQVTMQIVQKAWDCQWEPFTSLPCCPVEWELGKTVKAVLTDRERGTAQKQLPFEDFGLDAELVSTRNGEAVLTVRVVDPRRCQPGTYTFEVEYNVGQIKSVARDTIYIDVEVQ